MPECAVTPPEIFPSGFNRALQRPVRVRLLTMGRPDPCEGIRLEISSQNLDPRPIKVYSAGFQVPANDPPWSAPTASPESARVIRRLTTPCQEPPSTCTRVRPPGDVVKLKDRLYFLLQPPLETFHHTEAVRLPFAPFPYQWQGIAFLLPRVAAILADEMGLGKTIQAILAIRMLLHQGELRRVLLLCPKPLVLNWQREFGVWAAEIPLMIVDGPRDKRRWQWERAEAPVTLTNYEVLLRDEDLLTEGGLEFDLVVLDEAQRIKNRESHTSRVVRGIARKRSWALTGTPVENSVEDLLGIFEFLAPGHLSATMPLKGLGRAAADYILRRTKQEVLHELPPKRIYDTPLELSPPQRRAYELAESEGIIRLSEMGDRLTVQHVFELVLRLKQICNFDPLTGSSTKLERLRADLEEIAASGQKAIVFSQWVQTLQQIKSALGPYHPLEFHGRVPAALRERVLRQFRDERRSHVLLMTYGAGSVGLNLQFANYVFLFDRWWNPAVEDQAINRAHRIGVRGTVTVHRFLTVDTIEQRIHEILEEKRELFETILSSADRSNRVGLTQKEILSLFPLHPRDALPTMARDT